MTMLRPAVGPQRGPETGKVGMVHERSRSVVAFLGLAVAACATSDRPREDRAQAAVPPVSVAGAAVQPDAAPRSLLPNVADVEEDAVQHAFGTRHAYFQPASWQQLPGWREDRLADAWAAFQRSCAALGRKPAWSGPCERSTKVAAVSDESIRLFFEREFALYEIRNADRTPEGVITGYYEPLINGSRVRGGAYLFPVYGLPDDLLTIDVRLIPPNLRGRPLAARIEGRSVIPAPGGAYLIDVGKMQPDVRDKKLRVRLEGRRVVPYATRAEIERNGLAQSRVLVWVDNPAAFYSMQIQGAGKVRLPDGSIVRLGYAEQNGHPFQPPVRKEGAEPRKDRVLTRGLDFGLSDIDNEPDDPADAAVAPLTRGSQGVRPRPVPRPNEPLSQDVERLVEELATGKPATASRQPAARPAMPPVDAAGPAFPQPGPEMLRAISADPSFVFFREIPDGPDGPIGALGVPLTAGRSVAVDPRTTPLGYPVFMSTTQPGRKGRLNRLVMAQDTGGAIRGAVRADYFWGFGGNAWLQAARMKETGRMWLMLPHGQQVAARDTAAKTRGIPAVAPEMDCVIADPDLCVEDR